MNKLFGILLGLCLISMLICIGVVIKTNITNNPCVIEIPKVVVDAKIGNANGMFTSGPETYYIDYQGKRKLTKNSCQKRVRVTKDEYERLMYDTK